MVVGRFAGVVTTRLGLHRRTIRGALRLLRRKYAVPFVSHCHGRGAKGVSRIGVRNVTRTGRGLGRVTGQGRAVLGAVSRRNGLASTLGRHVRGY